MFYGDEATTTAIPAASPTKAACEKAALLSRAQTSERVRERNYPAAGPIGATNPGWW